MSATATVPWIPLATAAAGLIAGLGAGLGAAVWTQHRTDSREDVRWQRERDDRAEQWRREDRHRWLQDRQQAYARLIAALYEWDAVLLSAYLGRQDDLAPNTRTGLDAAERSKSAREALPLMQFMAPPAIRSQTRRAITDRESFWILLLKPDPPDPLKMDAAWTDLIDRTNSLRRAMRKDLGLESESGDAGQSGG